jgi:hypothetical protein
VTSFCVCKTPINKQLTESLKAIKLIASGWRGVCKTPINKQLTESLKAIKLIASGWRGGRVDEGDGLENRQQGFC